jgi:hypothetical protein
MIMKKKGGALYFSDIITSMASLGIMFVIIMIVTMTTFFLEYGISSEIYGNILYKDPMTENVLMGFMDMSYSQNNIDYRVGDLVTMAVWKGETVFDMDGMEIDMGDVSTKTLSSLSAGVKRKLVLVLDGEEIILNRGPGDYTSRAIILIKAGEKEAELILER